MMNNQLRGKDGEDLAFSYLTKHGFEIIERNYRFRRNEIDMIGLFNNQILVFFEIKNRASAQFGEPESFVTAQQESRIKSAAEEFIYGINWTKDIRFDIVSIKKDEVTHFIDAF